MRSMSVSMSEGVCEDDAESTGVVGCWRDGGSEDSEEEEEWSRCTSVSKSLSGSKRVDNRLTGAAREEEGEEEEGASMSGAVISVSEETCE